MNLDEVVLHHELSVEAADCRLDLENGLVGGHSQVDDSVVQTDVLVHDSTFLLSIFGLFFVGGGSTHLSNLIMDNSACILDLERKNGGGFVDHPELFNLELYLLRAGLYSYLWDCNLSLHLDDGLSRYLGGIGNHTLRDLLVDR